ncbi:LPS export ABC transporter periplasmic protein LptC [Roseomonas sp. BN140053]|uniref:LPS export ABC transporter periplasmic protein LptC n=1 Tax=Roseomonas sp. BN140053 TaxID=3391898 RepID=UPI0039E9CA03
MSGASGPQGGGVAPLPFPARDAASRDLPLPSRARRRPTRGSLLRRRWLLRAAKVLLPVGALGLLAAVALWPELDRAEDRARLSFRRVTQGMADAIRVVSPRYQGIDEQNRPFDVTAASATQPASDAPIALDAPRADMTLANGAWVLLESERGLYNRPADLLDLEGNVTVWHDNGTTMRTAAARIESRLGRAEGDRPVAAQGPFGTLTADGFRLENSGQVVFFTGNTHAMLEGSR